MKQEIVIDEKNKQTLLSIQQSINELQLRMRLVCQTILNMEGVEGNYNLTVDCSKLMKNEKESGEIKE